MPPNKHFLHRPINPDITRFRFVTGIIIWLGYAFSLYALFIVVREVYRILSLSPWHELVVLSDQKVRLYFPGSTPSREGGAREYSSGFVFYRPSWHIVTPQEYKARLTSLNGTKNIIGINQLENGDYLVDGKHIPATGLREILFNRIAPEKDYTVILFVNDAAPFNSFMHVLDNLHSAISGLRNIHPQNPITGWSVCWHTGP